MLVNQAVTIADSLLKAGLPHLEREAAAAAAAQATAASEAASSTLLEFPELGLRLRAQPVMGQAVWPAALALCHWLRGRGRALCAGTRCVELGAGGGAPGLVALANGAASLLTTDGDASLLPLLRANCEANWPAPADGAPAAWAVAALDWRDVDAVDAAMDGGDDGSGRFDLVMAADVLYSVGEITPLLKAAATLLGPTSRGGRLLVARSAWFEDLQPTLVATAEEHGFALASEETRAGGGASDSDLDESDATVLEFVLS